MNKRTPIKYLRWNDDSSINLSKTNQRDKLRLMYEYFKQNPNVTRTFSAYNNLLFLFIEIKRKRNHNCSKWIHSFAIIRALVKSQWKCNTKQNNLKRAAVAAWERGRFSTIILFFVDFSNSDGISILLLPNCPYREIVYNAAVVLSCHMWLS